MTDYRPDWVTSSLKDRIPEYDAALDPHCRALHSKRYREMCQDKAALAAMDREETIAHGASSGDHGRITSPHSSKHQALLELRPAQDTAPRPWEFRMDENDERNGSTGQSSKVEEVLRDWSKIEAETIKLWTFVGVNAHMVQKRNEAAEKAKREQRIRELFLAQEAKRQEDLEAKKARKDELTERARQRNAEPKMPKPPPKESQAKRPNTSGGTSGGPTRRPVQVSPKRLGASEKSNNGPKNEPKQSSKPKVQNLVDPPVASSRETRKSSPEKKAAPRENIKPASPRADDDSHPRGAASTGNGAPEPQSRPETRDSSRRSHTQDTSNKAPANRGQHVPPPPADAEKRTTARQGGPAMARGDDHTTERKPGANESSKPSTPRDDSKSQKASTLEKREEKPSTPREEKPSTPREEKPSTPREEKPSSKPATPREEQRPQLERKTSLAEKPAREETKPQSKPATPREETQSRRESLVEKSAAPREKPTAQPSIPETVAPAADSKAAPEAKQPLPDEYTDEFSDGDAKKNAQGDSADDLPDTLDAQTKKKRKTRRASDKGRKEEDYDDDFSELSNSGKKPSKKEVQKADEYDDDFSEVSNSDKKKVPPSAAKPQDDYDDDFSEVTNNSEKKPAGPKADEDTAYTEDEFDEDA